MEQGPQETQILTDLEKQAISAQAIKDMIDNLSKTEDGEPLGNAMKELKVALLQNPTACAMLLPEDIGEMVKFLMKVTGKDIASQMSSTAKKKAEGKKAPIDFTDENVLKQLENDLF